MDDVAAEESIESKMDFVSIHGDANKSLRAVLRMLKDFQQSNGYELYQRELVEEANILLATVTILYLF